MAVFKDGVRVIVSPEFAPLLNDTVITPLAPIVAPPLAKYLPLKAAA